jgi:hypothetical protein
LKCKKPRHLDVSAFLLRTHVKVSKNNIVRVIGNKEAEGLVQDIFIMGLLLDENDEILTRIQRLV